MSNKSAIISLVAETHIHVGVGQSAGALDLPVARERTTDYPFIPGSGVKGAIRVWAMEKAGMKTTDKDGKEVENTALLNLFGRGGDDRGNIEGAGNLLCSDARLLLLPVRCLSDAYKWVTCPAILERFQRDCMRAGIANFEMSDSHIGNGYRSCSGTSENTLGLEEREFTRTGEIDDNGGIIRALKNIAPKPDLVQRLVIISDKDFGWFARYALPVMARNKLDDKKTVVDGALWYEETLAPDTIMYLLLGQRNKGAVKTIIGSLTDTPYIQMGGNETIGQGWFRMGEVTVSSACGGENG
jgi:CRISPR-associated protein Cmr4